MDLYHVSFPGLGINDLPINRIAFSFEIGGNEFNIYWYGIIIAFAFLLCIILASKQSPKFGIKSDDIVDTFLWVIVLGLVGARLYYVAFSWDDFSGDFLKIFHTRDGGLAFYGGVIGGMIGIYIISKLKKINFIYLLDFFAVYLPLGQAIGRWGNFFNQEAFGTNTMLPWGMFSEGTYSYLSKLGVGYAPLTPVHPTFLYESIANFIIFFVLLKVRSKSKNTGKVVGLYFILYGIVRFFVEGIRTDPLYIGNTEIRVSQALSLVLVVLGIILIALAKKNTFSKNIPSIESEVDDAENSNQAMDDLSVESTDDSGENTTEEDTTEEDTAAEEMGDKSSQDIIKEPEENILGETENIEKNSESSESDTKIDE